MNDVHALDLNLLRLFDVVYTTRNVSRAAQQLGLSQPATSQALTRLRLALGDPLFERVHGGVRPTPRAEQLAHSVQAGLALLDAAVADSGPFDPLTSKAELRLHLTDIGEARFLPGLMRELRRVAPGIQVQAQAWPAARIAQALDNGDIHLAVGFLPEVETSMHTALLSDQYVFLIRSGHPLAESLKRRKLTMQQMQKLDLVAVRSHAETLRILQSLDLERRVKLTTSTFLALPEIVRDTDLAVLMPRAIAAGFEPADRFQLCDAGLSSSQFAVALHWSRRHAHAPMVRWASELLVSLFRR